MAQPDSADIPTPHGVDPQQATPSRAPSAEAAAEIASEAQAIREKVIEQLRTVYDPEIPVNIYELGLVYLIEIQPGGRVLVRMTLTSPACPVAGILPGQVHAAVARVEEVSDVEVDLVWDPPWNPGMMSEAARIQLNL